MASKDPAGDQFVMIIGAMKSGTSALFELLAQHPQVCPSRTKEPEFFSRDQAHGLAVDRYEDLWDFNPAIHRAALEASTGYTKFPHEAGVPTRIAAYGIEPRFLYVLRDPIRRAQSHASYAAWGKHTSADFLAPHVVDTSRYAMQLDVFTSVFPRDRIHVLSHAQLQRDPVSTCSEVFRLLGLDPFRVEELPRAKNAARPRSRWERRLMRSGRLSQLTSSAPEPVRDALRRLSAVGASGARPTMDLDTERALRIALADDMARLRGEWAVDVSEWGF